MSVPRDGVVHELRDLRYHIAGRSVRAGEGVEELEPHQCLDAVVWLCSDAAAFITGASLLIDGGRLAGTPAFAAMTKAL
jgi:NAD(P)-dependent dehydrogenase (short-subunit alcohol dehydrogenase family)